MEAVSRMGVDLAKRVIQLHCVDRQEHVILRRSIPTERFAEFMSRLQPCDVAMEACASAHHWARKLTAMGHSVRLIAPQFVPHTARVVRGARMMRRTLKRFVRLPHGPPCVSFRSKR